MAQQLKNKLYRPTWAEVNLNCIGYNIDKIRKLIEGKAKILAVLKADAYGHGAVKLAKKIKGFEIIEYFGTATVPEAIQLRENGINTPILILSTILPHEFGAIVSHNITPTISDLRTALSLNRYLNKVNKKIPVHLKIDTGMGRLGVWHEDALDFVINISKLKSLILKGIYTHFSSADEDKDFTNIQLNSFEKLISSLEKNGINIPLKHSANSAAVMRYKNSYLNLVRPGLMIYGLYPDKNSHKLLNIKPALSFKTRITHLKSAPIGRAISYDRTFVTQRESQIATVPVGYADGYNRLLSNRAEVLVGGRRCRVIGRVCMDHTMVDVTGVGAKIGDEVVLIGRQGKSEISAEEISHLCNTISYEVVCWISKRVPRIYIDN